MWAPKEARHGLSMNIQGGSEQGDSQRRGVVTWIVEKLMDLVSPGWGGEIQLKVGMSPNGCKQGANVAWSTREEGLKSDGKQRIQNYAGPELGNLSPQWAGWLTGLCCSPLPVCLQLVPSSCFMDEPEKFKLTRTLETLSL